MAYLIFSSAAGELYRRPLTNSLVIGRSPECDISVRDITLSRRHLKIERNETGWTAVDLASKNGSAYAGQRIDRHTLQDADVLRIGKTLVTFCVGSLKPGTTSPRKKNPPPRRPSDPIEALASTVHAMELQPAGEVQARRAPGSAPFPTPIPRPADPAYEDDEVYSMVHSLVSSSWDSIYSSSLRTTKRRAAQARW